MSPRLQKARFVSIKAAIARCSTKVDTVRAELEAKYGGPSYMAVMRATQTEKNRYDQAIAAMDRNSDRLYTMLDQISPRDWRRGVPTFWVTTELTYEDAVRPLNEKLSVVPPCAAGHSRPIQ